MQLNISKEKENVSQTSFLDDGFLCSPSSRMRNSGGSDIFSSPVTELSCSHRIHFLFGLFLLGFMLFFPCLLAPRSSQDGLRWGRDAAVMLCTLVELRLCAVQCLCCSMKEALVSSSTTTIMEGAAELQSLNIYVSICMYFYSFIFYLSIYSTTKIGKYVHLFLWK